MKISRIKHVLITSIIFLIIIGVIVGVYSSLLDAMSKNTTDKVYRIMATRDIAPGETITSNNIIRVQEYDVIDANGLLYREKQDDIASELVTDEEKLKADVAQKLKEDPNFNVRNAIPKDNLWAIGKVAVERIYKGEWILAEELDLPSNVAPEDTRLYSIPFESATTGGYNIELGEDVDICVLYNDDDRGISEYQNLPDNKVIDIVLTERRISDIRDESGNSAIGQENNTVVPGYVCFNLTYEEINRLELAKRQGTLFIGKPGTYYKSGSQPETFMAGASMPNF